MGHHDHGGHGHGCCDALDISAVPRSNLYLTQKVRCSGEVKIGDDVNEVQVNIDDDEEVTIVLPKKRTAAGPILITVCSGSGEVTVRDPSDCDDDTDESDNDLVLTAGQSAFATFDICCEWTKGKLTS